MTEIIEFKKLEDAQVVFKKARKNYNLAPDESPEKQQAQDEIERAGQFVLDCCCHMVYEVYLDSVSNTPLHVRSYKVLDSFRK